MATRIRAVQHGKAAVRAQDERRWDVALAEIRQARVLFGQLKPDRIQRADLARTFQLEGQVLLQRGSVEAALGAYGEAEDLMSQDPENVKHLGRLLYDIAVTMSEIGLDAMAEQYLARAAEALAGQDPQFARMISEFRGDLEAIANPSAHNPQAIDRLRREVANATSSPERAVRQHALGALLLAQDPQQDSSEAFALLRSAADTLRRHDVEKFVACLTPVLDLRDHRAPLPAWLDAYTTSAVELAQSDRRPQLRASAHFVRAAYLNLTDRWPEALNEALIALAASNEASIQLESSVVRLLHSPYGDGARKLALELACRFNDSGLVAELLESQRLQVLPVGLDRQRPKYEGNSVAAALRTISASGVSRLRPIAVGGASRLGVLYPPELVDAALDIDEYIVRVGGPDAWWWAAWIFDERAYWCVRRNGRGTCGSIDLTEGTAAREAMQTLLGASLVSEDTTRNQVLSGPLTSGHAAEERLSVNLGACLVPEVLRAELMDRFSRGQAPLSLVLSGNLFGTLPTPLLGLEPTSPGRYATRLVEAAVIRLAPPAALTDHVARRSRVSADSFPISIACVDPQGDLPHSGGVPPDAQLTFSGRRSAVVGKQETLVARAQSVVAELRKLGAGHPSLFFYSGHAGGVGDLESGLVFKDGKTLTAATIFAPSEGQPAIPFPTRAIVAACSSAGARGTGAGEWFGLSASILWAGASQVVATNWTVWDSQFTAWFDLRLAKELRTGDVADKLRRVQVECLDHWRRLGQWHQRGGADAIPLIWAAYSCIGIYN